MTRWRSSPGARAWARRQRCSCSPASRSSAAAGPTSARASRARDRWFIVAGAGANIVLNLAMFVAFVRIGIALALLIFYLFPAFVALASVAVVRRPARPLRWAALGISMLGLLLPSSGRAARRAGRARHRPRGPGGLRPDLLRPRRPSRLPRHPADRGRDDHDGARGDRVRRHRHPHRPGGCPGRARAISGSAERR